jgi:hypothetical protein
MRSFLYEFMCSQKWYGVIDRTLQLQEFKKLDSKPSKYVKQWSAVKPKTGVPYTFDIGYERFLGPEVCPCSVFLYLSTVLILVYTIGLKLHSMVEHLWLLEEIISLFKIFSNKENNGGLNVWKC